MNDVATIDADVAKARLCCKEASGHLPRPSALYTLVRFARWTGSVKELALFIRYQGSRRTTPADNRKFYHDLADVVEQEMADDIERARRFLGFVVRAAAVEDHKGAARSERGGGRR